LLIRRLIANPGSEFGNCTLELCDLLHYVTR
jgi:hypothetical protein